MDLSVICVNWNSVDWLRECIASIYENTSGIAFEIIVVDNASPLGGVEILEHEFPAINLIRSGKNLGFAAANNIGYRTSSGEHVLFLNPDTKLIGPSINILLGHMKVLPDAGVVGCKLLNSDRSVQLSSIHKFPTILNQAFDAEYLQLHWPNCPLWEIAPLFSNDVKVIKVDIIPGACMLLRRDAFEKVGMFSEDYFMYAEDLDLNYKLRDAGLVNYYVGETAIIHHGGKSSSRQVVSQWATVMKMNAMWRLLRNTRGRAYGAGYRAAMGSAAVGRLVVLALLAPFANVLWDGPSIESASKKWRAVLAWAVGCQDLILRSR
jgi:hypothetical protein